jgi:hypothetical protein
MMLVDAITGGYVPAPGVSSTVIAPVGAIVGSAVGLVGGLAAGTVDSVVNAKPSDIAKGALVGVAAGAIAGGCSGLRTGSAVDAGVSSIACAPVATARGVGDMALVGAQSRANQRMAAGAEGTSSVSSYQVGDVTRGILAMGSITRGSEDKSYKFGDFTRGLLAPSSGAAMQQLRGGASQLEADQLLQRALEVRLQMMGEEPLDDEVLVAEVEQSTRTHTALIANDTLEGQHRRTVCVSSARKTATSVELPNDSAAQRQAQQAQEPPSLPTLPGLHHPLPAAPGAPPLPPSPGVPQVVITTFQAGPLGLKLVKEQVSGFILIEAASGQAAAQGLQVGDKLVKVEEEFLAMGLDQHEAAQRIVSYPRPVNLTFQKK